MKLHTQCSEVSRGKRRNDENKAFQFSFILFVTNYVNIHSCSTQSIHCLEYVRPILPKITLILTRLQLHQERHV